MPIATYTETELRSGVCAAVWTVAMHEATDAWLVLPDGSIDVVLSAGGVPVVAGPATRPVTRSVAAGSRTVGVRLRPGAAAAVLGVAADELRDRSVPLDALPVRWAGLGEQCRVGTTRGGVSSAVELAGSGDLPGAGQALIAALAAAPHRRAPDPLAGAAAALLTDDPSLAAGDVARITSLSGRQLLRRCERSLGIGPKRYARIMRLQRFLAAGRRRPDLSLSELAFDTGYADHAHLAADCRELADRTPSALLGDRRAIAI